MSKARELAELSRTVSDSADATAITINSSEEVTFADDIFLGDDKQLVLGNSSDFTLKHHNSGYGHVQNTGTLYIDAETIELRTDNSSISSALTLAANNSATFSGSVGIGTSSPAMRLDVQGDTDTWIARAYNTGSDANAQGLLVRSDATSAHDALVFGAYADSAYKMVIKSTGKAGIGTNSPDTLLELVGADPILTVRDSDTSSGTANATIRLAESGASDSLGSYWDIKAVGGQLQFIDNWNEGGGTGTRVIIDDSGRFLHGTTDSNPADNSAGSTADNGVVLNSGVIVGSKYNDRAMYLNRTGSDGAIIELRKSGSSVGSIGTASGYLVVGSAVGSDAHLLIGNNLIHPATSTGGTKDNAITIGGSSNRFKDLHLSGTSNVGVARFTGQNLAHSAATLVIGHEGSSKSQIRAYGINAGTIGSLEFMVSAADGTGSHSMTLDQNGLGVGESSPLGKLHVKTADSGASVDSSANELVVEGSGNAGITILSGQSSSGNIYFGDAGVNWDGYIAYSQASRKFVFGAAAGTNTLEIDSNGALIGNSAQISKTTTGNLTSGNARAGAVLKLHHEAQWENGYTGGDFLGGIEFSSGDASGGEGVRAAIKTSVDTYYNTNKMRFYVAQGNSTTLTERMQIKNDGSVGVGTTDPEYRLQINGSNVSSGGGLATVGIFDEGTAYNGTKPGGGIAFRGKYNSSGNITNFGSIQAFKENATNNQYGSAMVFTTRAHGGNLTETLRIRSDKSVSLNDGHLIMSNGYGVHFGASAGSGMSSTVLDDYEEGVWTPTLPNGGSMTVAGATYIKIGKHVTVQFYLHNIAPTANTSAFQIGGLPYAGTGTSNVYHAGSIFYTGASSGDATKYGMGAANGSNYLYFHFIDGTGSAVVTNNNWISNMGSGTGKHLIASITYTS